MIRGGEASSYEGIVRGLKKEVATLQRRGVGTFFRNSSSTKGRRRRRIASGIMASWNRRRLYAK